MCYYMHGVQTVHTPVKNVGWHRARHPGTLTKVLGFVREVECLPWGGGELRDKPAEPVGAEAVVCACRGCFLHVHTVTSKGDVSFSSSAGLNTQRCTS